MDMRERIARNLFRAADDYADWDANPESQRYWFVMADVALEAMRYEDGTDEHLAIITSTALRHDAVTVIECWDGMIDAIQKEVVA